MKLIGRSIVAGEFRNNDTTIEQRYALLYEDEQGKRTIEYEWRPLGDQVAVGLWR